MKAPLSWIKEYVDVNVSPAELSDRLLNAGFEVEELVYLGEGIVNVVVGKILEISKHPNADKLKVCTIDVGSSSNLTIVTGANNVEVGQLVPVALDGAELPSGKQIKTGELRGVTSYGMLCGGSELNIDNTVIENAEVDGILILSVGKVGDNIVDVLGLNDYVLDIAIPANRSDCQSIYGISREISTVLNLPLKPLDLKYKTVDEEASQHLKIFADGEVCSRYMGSVITNVKIGQSPKIIRDRLRKVGVRSIDNYVDITNYVLAEVGQPMHVFDADIVGDTLNIRLAREGESILALDGKEYKLGSTMTVVASDVPLAIGGVMGGEVSGVKNSTKRIYLESARFRRDNIRKTSRALGLRSTSSARFEKGVDCLSVEIGTKRALNLIYSLKIGTILRNSVEVNYCDMNCKKIVTTSDAINSVLGIEIDVATIVQILNGLDIKTTTKGKNLTCTIPLYREDIDNFTDLAEEVIRVYGYDKIEGRLLDTAHTTVGGKTREQTIVDELKNKMCALGAFEINTYSFLPERHAKILRMPELASSLIRIKNPLSEEFSVMRTTLVYNMLDCIALNQNRKNKGFQLFEVGRGFFAKSLPLTELPEERPLLCYGSVCGNFFNLKNVAEEIALTLGLSFEYKRSNAPYLHTGVSADIICEGKVIGCMGEVHPEIAKNMDISGKAYVLELQLTDLPNKQFKYSALPKFPEVERDIAVVLASDILAIDVHNAIANAHPLISEVSLFDVYTGEQIEQGHKSLAYSIRLKGDKTLVESEINECMQCVLNVLSTKFSARLR